jgi:hypothetical protein
MRCIWLMFFCLMTSPLNASSLDRLGHSDLVLLGESRLSVLFWDIYDAGLYVTDGIYDPNKPFALALSYLRPFSGSDIAERSIEEIRNQGSDDEYFQMLLKGIRLLASVILWRVLGFF